MTDLKPISDRLTPVVLITDDDNALRSLLVMALKAEGYEIEEAINGEECLVKYARLQPDLVLLDAVMPEMDGFSCCQHIRALPECPQIPILMITFLDDRESIDQAFQAGATDYITKPIHWSVLRQRVRYLLASSHVLKQAEQQKNWEAFFRDILEQLSISGLAWESLTPLLNQCQQFFQVERILLYQFKNQQYLEAIATGYPSVQESSFSDLALESIYLDQYQQGKTIAIADLEQVELSIAQQEIFARLQTKTILVVPILIKEKLLGLLCVHRAEAQTIWKETTLKRFQDLAHLFALSHL
jgi:DNA-binding response OmpR family regulator